MSIDYHISFFHRAVKGFLLFFGLTTMVIAENARPQLHSSLYSLENYNNSTVLTDVLLFRNDIKNFILEPYTHWQATLLFTSSIVSIAASSFPIDVHSRRSIQRFHSKKLDGIISPWQYYGNSYVPWGIAASCYIGGVCTSNDWFRETGRECLSALLCSGLFTTALKVASGRERPYANEGAFDFDVFSFNEEHHSFPSGHATKAFALSTVLSSRINNPLISVLLYTGACLTAVQRVYSDQHWFSDVAAGALVGVGSGLFIVHNNNLSNSSQKNDRIHFLSYADNRGAVISLSYQF
jgi:membrane-associated phospholipid phosphatase